jgi:antitoxin component of MazEF toxin-antitoxin module
VGKRALAKVARHGNSAMIALPRPLLFHLDCLFGDYVLLQAQEDGTILLKKAELFDNASKRAVMMPEERPVLAKS